MALSGKKTDFFIIVIYISNDLCIVDTIRQCDKNSQSQLSKISHRGLRIRGVF